VSLRSLPTASKIMVLFRHHLRARARITDSRH
jgi:hypothetical protein